MGAYLSEPITNKETQLEENDELRVASSSMQGWRVSQEDAHNAIINFDDHTSLFAVYDGHGGHEVAEYTAKKLPAFIKQNKDYQAGNIHKALVDCFVEFDRTIVNRDVVAELKIIAGKPEDDIEDDEEVDNLYQEATMPIEDVIAKYEASEDENNAASQPSEESNDSNPKVLKNPLVSNLAGSSGSKGVSPFLRAKAPSIDQNGIKDESIAKEIDFNKDIANTDTTNGISTENIEEDKSKNKINGEHPVQNTTTEVNSNSDNSLIDNNVNKTSDISEQTNDSNDSKQDMSSNKSNGNGPNVNTEAESNDDNKDVNQEQLKKLNENGITESKGKGKGKGKGKSSSITSKTSGDCVHETKQVQQPKRASKSAAELYKNILNDDENCDDNLDEDDSDEDVAYGQDDSDSDEEEEGDDESAKGEEEEEAEDSDDEDEAEDDENGEGFIGGEFNEEPGNDSGCTAVVALLRGNELFVANAGDSRCVVCRDGKAIEMSFDHKPEDTPERDRIENAGGKVTPDGRVNGGLNLSRAIGDHAYKTNKNLPLQDQMISPVPDIRTLHIDPTKDSYIVLACDGIWNSLTSQEVVDFVSERIDKLCSTEEQPDPSTVHLKSICEELFEHCLAPDTMNDGTGMDNMTAVIVKLRSTFDGNKSAKNLLAGGSSTLSVGSSNATCLSPANGSSVHSEKINSNSISSNGDSNQTMATKRLNESNEESSVSETPSCKKIRLDDEKINSESVTNV